MIPYIAWTTIDLGPVHLQVWGMFVALGFLFGAFVAARMAKRRGLDPKIVYDILPWLMLAGIVGGRLGQVLFYEPAYYLAHPIDIFAIWEGGSSIFGGFIASLLVGIWYLRRRKVDFMTYADTLVFGLPFGMWIGRIGCFLIHDHPGTATTFFLGMQYPDGIVRHDLGLYESLTGLAIAIIFLLLSIKPRPTGTYLAVFCLLYSVVRFFFDFLRTTDAHYFGLTPAQYLCFLLFALGLGTAVWISKKPKIA